jgi:hypothetical protein
MTSPVLGRGEDCTGTAVNSLDYNIKMLIFLFAKRICLTAVKEDNEKRFCGLGEYNRHSYRITGKLMSIQPQRRCNFSCYLLLCQSYSVKDFTEVINFDG